MIKIIGPRDKRDPSAIDTTSHSAHDWSSGLSPFKLGPLSLYGNRGAQIFENAWQFAKLYPEHADSEGEPTAAYWTWAERVGIPNEHTDTRSAKDVDRSAHYGMVNDSIILPLVNRFTYRSTKRP